MKILMIIQNKTFLIIFLKNSNIFNLFEISVQKAFTFRWNMSVLKLTSALWIINFVNFLFSDSIKVHKNKKIIHVIFPHVVSFIIFLRLDVIKQGKKKWGKKKKKIQNTCIFP